MSLADSSPGDSAMPSPEADWAEDAAGPSLSTTDGAGDPPTQPLYEHMDDATIMLAVARMQSEIDRRQRTRLNPAPASAATGGPASVPNPDPWAQAVRPPRASRAAEPDAAHNEGKKPGPTIHLTEPAGLSGHLFDLCNCGREQEENPSGRPGLPTW